MNVTLNGLTLKTEPPNSRRVEQFKKLHGNYIVVDTNTDIGFVTVDAGGVASLLGITLNKVHDLFRGNVKMKNIGGFLIIKSPYFISSRRGGNMRAKK